MLGHASKHGFVLLQHFAGNLLPAAGLPMFFWNPESEAGTREMGADFAANEQSAAGSAMLVRSELQWEGIKDKGI